MRIGTTDVPCPFCGGVRITIDKEQRGPGYDDHLDDPDAFAYSVRCLSCAAVGPWTKTSEEGARIKWARRVA